MNSTLHSPHSTLLIVINLPFEKEVSDMYKDKKVLVFGMARSGIAAAKLLIERGAKVYICDSKAEADFDGALDELRAKRHDAVRGRRNGWVAASLTAMAGAALVFLSLHFCEPRPMALPPDFDAVVRIPPNAHEGDSDDEGGLPSRKQLSLARIDAWVLTHDLFADLKDGKITREKAVSELRRFRRMAADDDMRLFEPETIRCEMYSQQGESEPLVYLLQAAVSNLNAKAEKK